MKHLSNRDAAALANWLGDAVPLSAVLQADAVGMVGNIRFSERARRAYVLTWTWSAPRYAGEAGAWQDRCWSRHGAAFVHRRIARFLGQEVSHAR